MILMNKKYFHLLCLDPLSPCQGVPVVCYLNLSNTDIYYVQNYHCPEAMEIINTHVLIHSMCGKYHY